MCKLKKESVSKGISILVYFYFIYFSTKIIWDIKTNFFELLTIATIAIFSGLQLLLILRKKQKKLYSCFFSWIVIVLYIFIQAAVKKNGLAFFSRSLYEYIFYTLIFWAFYNLSKYINLNKCIKFLSIIGIVIAILSFIEFSQGFYLIPLENYSTYVEFDGEMITRAKVFTRSYLSHGMMLGIFSLCNFYIYKIEKKKRYVLGAILCYAAIFATASRGPLVAITGGYVIFIALLYRDTIKTLFNKRTINFDKKLVLILIGIFLFLVFIFSDITTGLGFIDYSLMRIRSIFNWTGDAGNVGRIDIWSKWFQTIKESFWFGIGASKTGSWDVISMGVTESDYLKRLVELGIIGFAIYYLFIYKIMIDILKSLKNNKRSLEIIFCIAISISILIDGVVLQVTEEIMVAFFLWAFLGIGLYYAHNSYSNNVEHGKGVLYYSHVDWNWIKQRPHFIAEGLSSSYDVTFVYQYRYNRKIMQKRNNVNPYIERHPIYVIPKGDNINFLNRINTIIRKVHIRLLLLLNDYEIIFITYPSQIDLVPKKYRGLMIYDCMDNHTAFITNEQHRIRLQNNEEDTVKRSHLTICSSQNLVNTIASKYSIPLERIKLVRNAYTGTIINDEYIDLYEKKSLNICYFGTISSWFDYDLLLSSLEVFDNIHYWLAGPIENGIDLPSNERVHFMGTIEHEMLYQKISGMDCFIMPFILNSIIENVDPVKLYEYINFNKNIISIRYKEIERFNPFVYMYETKEEFYSILQKLLKENNLKYSMEEREEFLSSNTWDSRIHQIFDYIEGSQV